VITWGRDADCPTGHCAGFDPATIEADRWAGEPLPADWQAALDGAVAEVRELRSA
jgi:hypothetical protein